jgi:hypothetical protein
MQVIPPVLLLLFIAFMKHQHVDNNQLKHEKLILLIPRTVSTNSVFQKRLKALVHDQRFYDYSELLAYMLMATFDFVLCFSFSLRLFLVILLFHFSI